MPFSRQETTTNVRDKLEEHRKEGALDRTCFDDRWDTGQLKEMCASMANSEGTRMLQGFATSAALGDAFVMADMFLRSEE